MSKLRRTVGAVVMAVLLAGCSSSTNSARPPTTKNTPAYGQRGPDHVGVTTLDLGSAGPLFGERMATVFYPIETKPCPGLCNAASRSSSPSFSYTQSQTLPTALQGVLPPQFNTTQVIDAWENVRSGTSRPYPVVLFSHGYGGERLYYSNLLAGIASWGYVVVSADYLERGLASQTIKNAPKPSPAIDQAVMFSSLAAAEKASADPASPLYGALDASKVAAVGHSAGGGTAFNALRSPKVATAIGWAPVPPSGKASRKPVMLIGAEGDIAVKPSSVKNTYGSFGGQKSLVEVSGEGHNTYTDICVGIRNGGGLINFAVANHFTSPRLAQLGINGCEAKDINPTRFWPIVQYYTVFQLKNVFAGHAGKNPVPNPAPGSFPGFKVSVTQAN